MSVKISDFKLGLFVLAGLTLLVAGLLQQDYARRVRLTDRTAAALVQGWNRALDEILTEVARDLRTTTLAQRVRGEVRTLR